MFHFNLLPCNITVYVFCYLSSDRSFGRFDLKLFEFWNIQRMIFPKVYVKKTKFEIFFCYSYGSI